MEEEEALPSESSPLLPALPSAVMHGGSLKTTVDTNGEGGQRKDERRNE